MELRERSNDPTSSGRGPPSVSIVIPHYLGDVIARCLRSVAATTRTIPCEIIVVDDQPFDDGSIRMVIDEFPGIRVARTRGVHGFGAACNTGIAVSRGSFIAILNNDVVVTDGWLDSLLAAANATPDAAVFQAKVRSLAHPSRFDYSGAAGGMLDWLGFPFALGRVFEAIEHDLGQYDEPRDIFWAVGCAMLVRREALDKIGGFDEDFYMHMEEIDLCWRMQRAGWRVRSCPGSVVYHENGHSLRKGSFKKAYLNHRNNLVLLLKNLPWRRAAWVIPLRILLVAAVAIRGIARRDWREPLAAILGTLWVLANLASVLRRRRWVRVVPIAAALDRLHPRSVVVDHFIRGIRSAKETLARTERRTPIAPVLRPNRSARDPRSRSSRSASRHLASRSSTRLLDAVLPAIEADVLIPSAPVHEWS